MKKSGGKDTPLMRQYTAVKSRYPDSFVFMRLGDFYELFGKDAVLASEKLDIVLTSRDKGPDAVPMAGVPHHSVMTYIKKLIDTGDTVVIVDQVEDAKQAKGIVKREVTRVITPGTVLEDELFVSDRGNALATVCVDEIEGGLESYWGLCVIDVSQGTVVVTGGETSADNPDEIDPDTMGDSLGNALKEVARFPVRELLIDENIRNRREITDFERDHPGISVVTRRRSPDDFWRLDERLRSHLSLAQGIPYPFINPSMAESYSASIRIRSVAVALEYIDETNPRALQGLDRITPYDPSGFMVIDSTTLKNLEIFQTIRTGDKTGSLFWAIDRTLTPGGKRLLAEFLAFPLLDPKVISKRHDAVQELTAAGLDREDLSDALKTVRDVARLCRRLTGGKPRPVDALGLSNSLKNLPEVKKYIGKFSSGLFGEINSEIDTHEGLASELEQAIDPEGSLTGKDGGYIRAGFNPELDELRVLMTGGRDKILALQASERTATGIRNLKVGFNKVFGYFIEVTKSNISNVPDRYIRKQTLVNSERYITQELKDLESKVLGAEERARTLEEELFSELVTKISGESGKLIRTASALAYLDVILSFSRLALEYGWIRPELSDMIEIRLTGSKHPVLEQTLPDPFIPNDADLHSKENQMNIITGPNMAGKSTYMRQVALIVLLNQIGSYIPAEKARLGIFDRLFSRVGATDDLALGQSTFMVEMLETAHILHSCTPRSLVILDEIGRGTSTYDGLAIAWSVAEFLANRSDVRPITLFATHYHELTRLAESIPTGKNWRITLQERGGDIIFLRRVVEGKAGRSYGIQVAKLAGLPGTVIDRANEILSILEVQKLNIDITARTREPKSDSTLFLPLPGLDEFPD